MDLNLDGDVALVTASSSGLGKASARSLVDSGADVVINGRDRQKLDDAVRELSADCDGAIVGEQADLTDPEAVEQLVERPVEAYGSLDHLVISVGGPPRLQFGEATDKHWHDAFELLVMSCVRLVRCATPYLLDGGGTITAITSRAVKEATATNVLSSSVRMSVVGLCKCLSNELAPEVRVNVVIPGPFDTPRRSDSSRGSSASASTPVGRIGNPVELGDTVAFVCSFRGGFINGSPIVVDGGAGRSTL